MSAGHDWSLTDHECDSSLSCHKWSNQLFLTEVRLQVGQWCRCPISWSFRSSAPDVLLWLHEQVAVCRPQCMLSDPRTRLWRKKCFLLTRLVQLFADASNWFDFELKIWSSTATPPVSPNDLASLYTDMRVQFCSTKLARIRIKSFSVRASNEPWNTAIEFCTRETMKQTSGLRLEILNWVGTLTQIHLFSGTWFGTLNSRHSISDTQFVAFNLEHSTCGTELGALNLRHSVSGIQLGLSNWTSQPGVFNSKHLIWGTYLRWMT